VRVGIAARDLHGAESLARGDEEEVGSDREEVSGIGSYLFEVSL